MASTFLVRIFYREPTYELRSKPRVDPYEWQVEVGAYDAEDARRLGLRRFGDLAKESSVHWCREVESVIVFPPGPPGPPPASAVPVPPLEPVAPEPEASESAPPSIEPSKVDPVPEEP